MPRSPVFPPNHSMDTAKIFWRKQYEKKSFVPAFGIGHGI